jgi:hypothetical protein
MTKNPFYNAISAIAYIALVVLLLTFMETVTSGPDTFLAPIMMISLFTLSAAVMGYIFVYQPLRMYLEGEKEKAVQLFLQTVGIFGGITILLFVLYLTGIF